MIKCVGAKRKQGEMVDKETGQVVTWDSVRFSLVNDRAPDTHGLHCEVLKISHENYKQLTGRDIKDYREFVDKEVSIDYYSEDGKLKLASFTMLNPPAQNQSNNK